MQELYEILAEGGWGVAALFCIAIVVQWRDSVKLREQLRNVAIDSTLAMQDLTHAIRERRNSL